MQLGVALTSLLAVGGMSSVVVALACQEPATHLVYGLLVAGSDKVERHVHARTNSSRSPPPRA